jgi:hypothetical protein
MYWKNIGFCSSWRSLYRLVNYTDWKPAVLSPLLHVNLSVAKNFPFYVQDIWKVRLCKTYISTSLTINLQTKTHHTHPKVLKLFLHVKCYTDCCGLAFMASGELKVNKLPARLPMNVFNLKEKTMMNWWSWVTIEMTLVGITAASNFVNLLSLDLCSQGQVFYFNVCAEQLTNF